MKPSQAEVIDRIAHKKEYKYEKDLIKAIGKSKKIIKENDENTDSDEELDPRKTFSTNKAIKEKKIEQNYLVKKEREKLDGLHHNAREFLK